jgi:hypothetical protein
MRSGFAAAAILLCSVAATATGLGLMAVTPQERVPAGMRVEDAAVHLLLQASLTLVGVLVVWRRPGNRVGWLLSAGALLSAAQFLFAGYSVFGLLSDAPPPRADLAAWVYTWSGAWLGLPLALVALSFPDGRIRLRRAKVGVAVALLITVLLSALLALRPGPLFNVRFVENPFGLAVVGDAQGPLLALVVIVFLAGMGLMLSSLWERFRRSTGDERLQLKWVLEAAGVMSSLLLIVAFPLVFTNWDAAKVVFSVAVSLVPLSIGVAILRHRLYDIDVLINRTLVYGLTTGGIAAAFFGAIVILQTLLRPFTTGSEIAVAASTLLTVALFQPLRSRMQQAVDRRFSRARYDAARTLDAFAVELRDEVDLESVQADLLAAVNQTMSPAHASLWLRGRAR